MNQVSDDEVDQNRYGFLGKMVDSQQEQLFLSCEQEEPCESPNIIDEGLNYSVEQVNKSPLIFDQPSFLTSFVHEPLYQNIDRPWNLDNYGDDNYNYSEKVYLNGSQHIPTNLYIATRMN